jgi:hypothetical protein
MIRTVLTLLLLVNAATAVAQPAGTEKKPEPTKPILWDIYVSIRATREGHVGMLVGTVEAADENEAIEKAPAWSKQHGEKLIAVPAVSDQDTIHPR